MKRFRPSQWAVLLVLPVLLCSVVPAQEGSRGRVFEHDKTNFPLTGRHRTIACAECHLGGQLEGTPVACEACHWDRRQDDRYNLQLGINCAECHTTEGWKAVSADAWNHEARTGFRLEGYHRSIECTDCHTDGFEGLSPDCISCHQGDFERAESPNHVALAFPNDCVLCHTSQTSWGGAVFNHANFPLRGQHQTVACVTCHKDGVFEGLASECIACHRPDFESTTDPNHVTAGFPTDCVNCHGDSATSWDNADFDHSSFPLRGKHETALCSSCHADGVFAGLASDCISCHRSEFESTTDPNHVAAGFSNDCASCHGGQATAWDGATFEHDNWPLRGQHQATACATCHKDGVFAGLASECISCHRPEFEATTDPNHVTAGFPTDCVTCHGDSATSWDNADFNHDTFPLRGKHETALCSSCHKDGVFAGLASDCISCHRSEFESTTDPNHVAAGFSNDCVSCHGDQATAWDGATFEHDNWPLRGQHQTTAACATCHKNGVFAGLASDCVSCHRSEFDSTTDPNHVTAGFPTDCVTCHGTPPPGGTRPPSITTPGL